MFILCGRIECPFWTTECTKYKDVDDCHMTVFENLFPCCDKICFETATLIQEQQYRDFNVFYSTVENFGTKVPLFS